MVEAPEMVPREAEEVMELSAPSSTVVALMVPLLRASCPLEPRALRTTVLAVIEEVGVLAKEMAADGEAAEAVSTKEKVPLAVLEPEIETAVSSLRTTEPLEALAVTTGVEMNTAPEEQEPMPMVPWALRLTAWPETTPEVWRILPKVVPVAVRETEPLVDETESLRLRVPGPASVKEKLLVAELSKVLPKTLLELRVTPKAPLLSETRALPAALTVKE